ncbi:AB hydrolase-1 domain-containing protein [Aphelenchoides fujianensis]|nr:AB hydrolase-1 domain-containing protein [Aphelenchoides fujianensis]
MLQFLNTLEVQPAVVVEGSGGPVAVVCPVHDQTSPTVPQFEEGSPLVKYHSEPEKTGVLQRMRNACRWVGRILNVVSPPFPHSIITKASFTPPARGSIYFLIYGPEDARRFTLSAKEAVGQPHLTICLRELLDLRYQHSIVFSQALRLRPAVIQTPSGDHLVLAHVPCSDGIQWGVDIADFLKCDVVVYDYSGVGVSTGVPTEAAVYENVETIFKYAKEVLGYAEKDVIIFGFSMGSASAIHLASITPQLGGLVLFAPFLSVMSVLPLVSRFAMKDRYCRYDRFLNYLKIKEVRCRVLCGHGMADALIPAWHSEVLMASCPTGRPPILLPDVGHQPLYGDRTMWNHTRDFILSELGGRQAWEDVWRSRAN